MLNKKVPFTVFLEVIASVLLIIGISSQPYNYYIFLRWYIFITSIAVAYSKKDNDNNILFFIFVAIGIVFNPLIPFQLTKNTWQIVDTLVACLFIYDYVNSIYSSIHKPDLKNVILSKDNKEGFNYDGQKNNSGNFIVDLFEKHKTYFTYCYYISSFFSFFGVLYYSFKDIGLAANAGFLPFIVTLVLTALVFSFSFFIWSIINTVILAVLLLLPYLLIRGLTK